MPTFEFKLPDIGEGVVDGEVVAWKVAEGDRIELDQPMVEVMTDKATVEIPSPRAGRVARLHVAAGAIARVGQVLISIEEGAAARSVLAAAPTEGPAAPAPSAEGAWGANGDGARAASAAAAAPGGRTLATPATRRLARELGVPLAEVAPTGRAGRVTSDDVRRAAASPPPAASTAGSTAAPTAPPASAARPSAAAGLAAERAGRAAPRPQPSAAGGALEERVPLRGLRRTIAEHMARSKHTAAHFTYVEEVDVTELVALRARAQARAVERGVALSYLPFIVKAAVAGLRRVPSINSSLDEERQEIVRRLVYHVGIATQGPQGLVVGVVRDADARSLLDLAREIERLSAAIRAGSAAREDLVGSTFTVSSLGKLGGLLATPIINHPESAILGVHRIVERPVVVGGQIVVRSMMNLSLSVDHRIADGWDAAVFVGELKGYLEDPTSLFLEMV